MVPAGATVSGQVTGSRRLGARQGTRAGRVPLQHADDGRGELRHADRRRSRAWQPATKGEDATKIGIGAGAGAIIGGLLGGKSGAAKGGAIGGGAGTGVVLATKGKEIRLAPGADVTTTLTAPLTVRIRSS